MWKTAMTLKYLYQNTLLQDFKLVSHCILCLLFCAPENKKKKCEFRHSSILKDQKLDCVV